MMGSLSPRRSFDVPCTIEVEHTFESFHAHLSLDGELEIEPGDEVLVHGEPIRVPYGEKLVVRRDATVTKAGWLERQWTRLTGDTEFMELLEFSFSSGRKL